MNPKNITKKDTGRVRFPSRLGRGFYVELVHDYAPGTLMFSDGRWAHTPDTIDKVDSATQWSGVEISPGIAAHLLKVGTGLNVEWVKHSEDGLDTAVGYVDGSYSLLETHGEVQLTFLGKIPGSPYASEILTTDEGRIVHAHATGLEIHADRDAWLKSLADGDKPAALALLARGRH